MKLSHIKYGRRKIKIEYTLLKDCYGLYDPNTHILKIDKRQSGTKLFNTINGFGLKVTTTDGTLFRLENFNISSFI